MNRKSFFNFALCTLHSSLLFMSPEQWLQVKELFHAAAELKPEARGEYLRARCNGDRALLRVLLEAYKDASEVQGKDHWRTKNVERDLAALYEVWKKPAEAKK